MDLALVPIYSYHLISDVERTTTADYSFPEEKRTMRKAYWMILGLPVVCCIAYAFADAKPTGVGVPFPEGYRKWTFLHTTVVGPKSPSFGNRPCEKPCTGGLLHFYANDKAMEGLRSGTYADGAVIADELLELHGREDGAAKEGMRRGVGVMVKDRQRYASTGGWGFASYDGDSKTDNLNEEAKQKCFQCHVPRKDQDYVFTAYRER
jgi:hypothetical protein